MKALPLVLIKMYQTTISPYLPSVCRFTPTCSEYAYQSIEEHGVVKGLIKTLVRIGRCNPLGAQGYDPAE